MRRDSSGMGGRLLFREAQSETFGAVNLRQPLRNVSLLIVRGIGRTAQGRTGCVQALSGSPMADGLGCGRDEVTRART